MVLLGQDARLTHQDCQPTQGPRGGECNTLSGLVVHRSVGHGGAFEGLTGNELLLGDFGTP